MFEKYNAFEMGIGGGGGEYTPQIGFGWSNGVALVLLNTSSISSSSSDGNDESLSTLGITLVSVAVVLAVFLIGGMIYFYVRPKWSPARNSKELLSVPGPDMDNSLLQ
jgi:hypothetical protein